MHKKENTSVGEAGASIFIGVIHMIWIICATMCAIAGTVKLWNWVFN